MLDFTKYSGLTVSYKNSVSSLVAPINILPLLISDKASRNIQIEINALWDTGATVTCIKPELFDRLKLRLLDSVNHTMIAGIGGKIAAKTTLISLFITSTFEIAFCPVYVADFPGKADILIGMDIINKGDFVICNTNSKTSFSFVVPSLPERTDLAQKAEAINLQNTNDKY
ncbi:MAG: retroviral-like aspartic protease family protein [Treponema sp.]|nr:retroviral-like aspartic protease family protein [Treponema sp.]